MKRRKSRNNKGIATWLKWLLGIMVVGFVLCLATCGAIGFFGYQTVQDAMNPEKAEKVAHNVADIQSLPPTYKYTFGMDMMGVMTMVAINNTATKMTYMLIKVPTTQAENQPKTADEFVEQMATQGVPQAGGSSGKTTIEVKEKGKTKVGGVDMPYIVGISENSNTGKKQPAFLGCVMPTKETAILVCAAGEDETKPIDMAEVNSFLSNIKSFK